MIIGFLVVMIWFAVSVTQGAPDARSAGTQGGLHTDATVRTASSAIVNVEIADTPAERAQGLSDLPSMNANQGMLFLFPTSNIYPFWMPRMHFPLDIIWLKNGQVVDSWINAPAPLANQAPAQYVPKAAANEVLEINAGEAKALEINIGSTLDIQLPNGYTWPTK